MCAIWWPAFGHAESQPTSVPAYVHEWLQSQMGAQPKPADVGQQAVRLEVVLGTLNPRIKLAPCQRVGAYLPSGAKLWGKTHVGLRCEQGAVRWNVFWPVTVKVWGTALVAAGNLNVGQQVSSQDLKMGEVDLAEAHARPLMRAEDVVGRSVQRRVLAGQALRDADLKARRWFSAGDPVRLRVTVPGNRFQAVSEAKALAHGDEGKCVRLRTAQGKIVCAQAVGANLAEIVL